MGNITFLQTSFPEGVPISLTSCVQRTIHITTRNAHVGHWLSVANCINALRAAAFHYLTSDRNVADARSNKAKFTHIFTKPATSAPVRARWVMHV